MDNKPPNQSSQHWIWFFVAAAVTMFFCVLWLFSRAWVEFATTTLSWDSDKTLSVTQSAGAVLFAVVVYFGVKRVAGYSSDEQQQKQTALQNLVIQPVGLALLYISYTLSINATQWHIDRITGFALAALSCAMVGTSHVVLFKQTKSKFYLAIATVWIVLLLIIFYRFIAGWKLVAR